MTKFRTTLLTGAITLAIGLAAATPAQAASSYYHDFGGKPGITALINQFVGNVAADKRINFYFAHTNIPALKAALVEQVCNLEGGPCTFDMSMRAIHKNMGVTQNAFNALAEDMIHAMDEQQIPTAAQNNLLAKLAAMEPEIVTK
ncbi:group I truncated hemoglobin [Acidiphilium acidophilum]|uniref:Group 1 truncated hemoglobin n=1 Tax=Acidiphilium acidophilum TaxID=76588 RepID=A0AAW9DMT4_ACIAO|nr:group 1 truncated hemoglobin [Acidiphilium acidophilum]MDX5930310.1 group 1 truncated hemoglobin [Acidiphilium acidophilum]GBQ29918.1 hemoglobin-like protein [Acidiphilium acidophilum DSM 700]